MNHFKSDEYFINRTLTLAHVASLHGEVPVGAVIVSNNQLISEGSNNTRTLCDPTAHAEILALRNAGIQFNSNRLPTCTLYTSLEPCGMCIQAIKQARIKRLVFACLDENLGCVWSNNLDTFYPLIVTYTNSDCARSLLQSYFIKKRKLEVYNST
ncbi:MAG: nucleoside deaminase [Methylacidiphilales bacterium]|nr:nucleoside deaminase [Candidatus Methylacidiphilales bacterium]